MEEAIITDKYPDKSFHGLKGTIVLIDTEVIPIYRVKINSNTILTCFEEEIEKVIPH